MTKNTTQTTDEIDKSDAGGASEGNAENTENGAEGEKAPLHDSKQTHKAPTRLEKIRKRKEILDDEERREMIAQGLDPDEQEDDADDDKPVTRGDLKRIDRARQTQTALDMAEDIEDDDERAAIKNALTNRIKPSGNPEQDFIDARAIANRDRNARVAQEATRSGDRSVRRFSSGGAPARQAEAFEPTNEERRFMGPPFNMTEKEIRAARTEALRISNQK